MESKMFLLFSFRFAILALLLSVLKSMNKKKHQGKLPPGSLGWPYIGETIQLFSQDPDYFFFTRKARYGEIFKTHILGCPSVVLTSPEAIKYVLVTQAALFKPTYPPSKEKLIGPSALFFHQGSYHMQTRKLVQASLSVDVLRKLVSQIESIAISALEYWSILKFINTFYEMKKFTFDVAVLSIFGELDTSYKEELKRNYSQLDSGYNSFPINLPGTWYRASLTARRKLGEILEKIIQERKERICGDKNLLSRLLNFKDGKKEQFLNEKQIADNIIGVLFAAQDTTASILTWIFKYIHDDPSLFEAIKEEQTTIYELNGRGSFPLTWRQTRNMPITSKIIMESLRMASIISFTYREAVEDVEYKGYLIPKGWKVLPLFRHIHHDADFFIDPQIFKPSRFEVAPRANLFMPFGTGEHSCPGNEVAKLEILILLHHLTTKFRFDVMGPVGEVEYEPFPIPEQGLPIKIWKQHLLNSPLS